MSTQDSKPSSRTMLASVFPDELPAGHGWREGQLFAEGLLVTGVSTLLPGVIGLDEVGMIAMFLMAAALTDRAVWLLEENRQLIFDDPNTSNFQANRRTSISVFALFMGILVGFSATAIVMGESSVLNAFAFVARVAHLDGNDVFHRDFGTFSGLVRHNLGVLAAVMLLSFLYRAYGAMLALGWNACVWAIVITVLVSRAVDSRPADGVEVIGRALIGIGPHLLFEGASFVVGSLAAIFFSKAIVVHTPDSPVFWSVIRSVLAMVAAALTLLFIGAYLESVLPLMFL